MAEISRGAKPWNEVVSQVEEFDDVVVQVADGKFAKKITKSKFKDALAIDIAGISLMEGGTLESPTVLPAPSGSGGDKVYKAGTGYYSYNGDTFEAPSGNDWYLLDNGSSWSLKDMGALPDSSAKIEAWTAGTYSKDVVKSLNGKIYRAKVSTSEAPSPSAVDWEEIWGDTKISYWVPGSYIADAVVTRNGKIYRAKVNTSEAPTSTSVDWGALGGLTEAVKAVLNPIGADIPNEKATADYVDRIAITRTILPTTLVAGKFPYLSDVVNKQRTEYLGLNDAPALTTLVFKHNYLESDKVEIVWDALIYEAKILFVNNGKMVTRQYILTANDLTAKRVILSVPKGTQEIYTAVANENVSKVSVTVISTAPRKLSENFNYKAFDNLIDKVTPIQYKRLQGANADVVVGGVGAHLLMYIPIKPVKVEMYGINPHANDVILFSDINKKPLKVVTKAELVTNVRADAPTKWDMRISLTPPANAAYISLSNDNSYYSNLNTTDIYTSPIDKAVIWQDIDVPKTDEVKLTTFRNDLKGQINIARRPTTEGTTVRNPVKVLNFKNESENKVGRLAFRFKIREDVNTGTLSEKKLVEVKSADGTKYFNFVANISATSQLSGKDASAYPNSGVSYYPIPQFNSGFGVRTNLTSVTPVERRTMNYPNRTFTMGVGTNKHYKPIVGDNLFYVRFSSEDQTIMTQWSDIRLITNDTSITLQSLNNGLTVSTNYASFGDMIGLYRDFKAKVLASPVGSMIEFYSYNLGSYRPDAQYVDGGLKTDLFIETNDICKIDVPLLSQYYNIATGVNKYDGFPAYVMRKIDRSWHTFELIAPLNYDVALFSIDGQWMSDVPGLFFAGFRQVWEKGGSISIGSELAIDVKDLTLEFDVVSDVDIMDNGSNNQIFASDYHPNIMHFFGHDIYHLEDQNVPMSEFAKYQQYVSEGGFIPDSLKPSDPLYKGDDGPLPVYRKHLAHPTFKLEQLLTWLKNAGYVNITHKELAAWQREGKKLPSRKCYMLDFDDTPTYIYDDLELRNLFKRYNCRPAFAIELGYYVDSSIATSYNSGAFIAEVHDTDTHRLELQRRVRNMQLEGWDIVIHGPKDGYFHNGRTFKEYMDNIKEAIRIANKMGFDSQYWCLSSSGSTPNSVKIHEHLGILITTSTVDTYVGLCHHPNYSGRIKWETQIGNLPQNLNKSVINGEIK